VVAAGLTDELLAKTEAVRLGHYLGTHAVTVVCVVLSARKGSLSPSSARGPFPISYSMDASSHGQCMDNTL
jgi:hypothetical protein